MRRVLRWLAIGFLSLLLLVVIALATVHILAERKLAHRYPVPQSNLVLPTDSASIADGLRLALLRGCSGGCHGQGIEGQMFVDDLLLARLPAPNLTRSVRDYSTSELEAIIRHGVRPDGKSLVGMPSEMFRPLSDEDLGKIVAYLKSVPPSDGPGRGARLGPMAWLGLVTGLYQPTAELVKDAEAASAGFPAAGDSTARGAYLARTVCAECHGVDLKGGPKGSPPDLRIVAGYSAEDFTRLMRTGKALGDRELKLMSEVARKRLVHFTDQEIQQLHTYLTVRAGQAVSISAPVSPPDTRYVTTAARW